MSSSVRKQAPPPQAQAYTEESGIECSPTACAKACGGCIMFLISLTAISALGVIAGGAFWTAQAMYNVTQGGKNAVDTQLCFPSTITMDNGKTKDLAALGVTTAKLGTLTFTVPGGGQPPNLPTSLTLGLCP